MTTPSARGLFGPRFARDLWRLTRMYWRSPEAPFGALLLAIAVSLELATVQASVLMAGAEGRVFDALGDREVQSFFAAMGLYLGVIGIFVFTSTFRIWVRARLEIRWRRFVTAKFVERWIGPDAYCQAEMNPGGLDNPDQRIAEDVRTYVSSALGLSLSLLSAAATLYSFGSLLWRMSGEWPVRLWQLEFHVPGLMLWVAIAYAVAATAITHFVGRPLVPINFDRLRYEADFRYGLVHFRDNVEAVALARGQEFERRGSDTRFGRVVGNWLRLIGAQARLTGMTTGMGQVNGLMPILIGAPAYFAHRLSLGSLAQTRIAYGQFSGALAWFVNAYQEIAVWRASIERLSTFLDALEGVRTRRVETAGLRVAEAPAGVLRLDEVRIDTPRGEPLLEAIHAEAKPGERIAIIGPAGAGKTTLFRAIAGIWPFGSGHIAFPKGARSIFLTQQPYLPLGTLREVITYPAPGDAFPDAKIREILDYVGLRRLAPRLDAEEAWEHVLSGDERQRLLFARVLVHEPDWIFADDATASLDEAMEKRVYDMLRARLPNAAVLSISQRPHVLGMHERRWTLVPRPSGAYALESS